MRKVGLRPVKLVSLPVGDLMQQYVHETAYDHLLCIAMAIMSSLFVRRAEDRVANMAPLSRWIKSFSSEACKRALMVLFGALAPAVLVATSEVCSFGLIY